MANVMHFPGKLVDPVPATPQTYHNRFWGTVYRHSGTLYGPDAYGASYELLRHEYDPVLDRTTCYMKPVVRQPK